MPDTKATMYDRKEDEQLPRGAIQDAVREGVISTEEIVDRFRSKLMVYEGMA